MQRSALGSIRHAAGAALVLGLAGTLVSGCGRKIALAMSELPDVEVSRPLRGEVAVLLPYDVRPPGERGGQTPQMEAMIPLPYVAIVKERGNYVTKDSLYDVPYEREEAAEKFGSGPVIPAAFGENLVACLQKARLFNGVTRLCPREDDERCWDLGAQSDEIPLSPAAGTKLWDACRELRNGRSLQVRAARAPLPDCASRWLLRVRVVHFYATYHRFSTTVTASTQYTTQTSRNATTFPAIANAVLDCELFLNGPQPRRIWQRVIRSTWVSKPKSAAAAPAFLRNVLDRSLCKLVKSLAADLPRIRDAANRIDSEATADAGG